MHEALLNPIFSIFSESDICPHSLSSFSSASSTCRGSFNALNFQENNYNYSNNNLNNLNNNFSNNRNNNKNHQSDIFMKNSYCKRQDYNNNENNNNNLYRNHSSTSDSEIFDKKHDFLFPSYFGTFERNYMHYYLPDSSGDSLGSEKLPLL